MSEKQQHLAPMPALTTADIDSERHMHHGMDDLKDDHLVKAHEVGADGAVRVFEESQYDTFTPEESKAIVRKLDWRILPLLCLVYGICYVDKNAMSWAVVFNYRTDTNMKGQDYSWASSIFYFGYIAGSAPGNYLLTRFPTVLVVTASTVIWGALLLGQMGCHQPGQVMAIRFLLGFFEAPLVPVTMQYTATWYTRAEQTPRSLVWGSMQGLLSIVFGLVSWGYGHLSLDAVMNPWRCIFLTLGALSFVIGLGWILFMPNEPHTAKFFDDHEKRLATRRVAENMMGTTGASASTWKNYQVWHALKDPLTWFVWIYMFVCMVPNGGLTAFNTLVIRDGLGFDSRTTMLVTMPSSVFSAGALILWSLAATRFSTLRTWGLSLPLVLSIAGIATVYATSAPGNNYNKWGRAFAFWMINSYAVCYPFLLTVVAQNFGGRTKRAVVSTGLFIMQATGNIAGPFFFPSSDAPRYSKALSILLAFFCVQIVMGIGFRVYFQLCNNRRDAKYGPVTDPAAGAKASLEDKTDNENPDFRYVY